MGSHTVYAQAGFGTVVLPISVSQVARVTGMSHWHPAPTVLNKESKAGGITLLDYRMPKLKQYSTSIKTDT
jgi:hypothetical protein